MLCCFSNGNHCISEDGNLIIKKETNNLGEFMDNMNMTIKNEIDDEQLQAGLAVLEEMGESFFT